MDHGDRTETGVDEGVQKRLERVLARHPISFAMLFGSAGRGTIAVGSDLDLAVEFDAIRPTTEGYSRTYLQFQTDLADTLSVPVDVVDIHSMSPEFARAAFTDGTVIVGSDAKRSDLESTLAGEVPSMAEAHDRVAAAVTRLREGH